MAKATHLVAFFVLSASLLFGQQSGTDLTFRAIWVARGSMVSPQEIDRALEFAANSGFNHVFVQVRGRGEAFYESDIVPRAEPLKEGFDPLRYAVQKGHALGLTLHAWMNTHLVWSSETPPQDSLHVLIQHAEWIDKSSFPSSALRQESGNGKNSAFPLFLSPADPGATRHLLAVLEEVVTKYDVDGLHLDYVRYGDVDFGYQDETRRKFQEMYGVDPIDFLSSQSSDPNLVSSGQLDFLRKQWNQFRRDAVTEFVRRCNALILEHDPHCVLSVAVKPSPNQAKRRYFQEWDRWLMEGLVDYVVPMNYEASLREFAHNIDVIEDNIPRKYLPGIIMGTAVYNQNAMDATDKIKYAKITGFSGISIFSYDARKNELEYFIPVVEEMTK